MSVQDFVQARASHASGEVSPGRKIAPSARTRLCVLLPSHWQAHMGGAEHQVKLLLDGLLADDRFDIHYAARLLPEAAVAPGYTLHRIRGGRRFVGAFFPDVPALWRLLKAIDPDVIYQRVGCAYTGVAAHYARRFGRRLVWHLSSDQDVAPQQWRWSRHMPALAIERALVSYGARHADVIVAQTERQEELVRRHHGQTRVVRLANFHPEPVESLIKANDRVRVCWIANMKPLKRPELFLRLAGDLAYRKDVEFVLIGRRLPREADWLPLQAQIYPLSNVRYLGALPTSSVLQELATAHLLVNTSDYEGFSNTFIQAWQREVPVVSLRVNPDGAFDGERLGVCAGGSYPRLLAAVDGLIGDGARRREMGRRAREHALQTFSVRNRDRLIELLTN